MKIRIVVPLATALVLFSISFSQPKNPSPSYNIQVRLEPDSGLIECRVEIRNTSDSCFVLNNDMSIRRLIADGRPVSFHRAAPSTSGFMPNSSEVIVESNVSKTLQMEYSGRIKPESFPPMVNVANMINHDLVELAMYVSWYPKPANVKLFNFSLEVDAPSKYVTVTNGKATEESSENGRDISKWKSFQPGFDVVVLSAPHLVKSDTTCDGMKVEIYYNNIPPAYVDSMKSNLLKSMGRLIAMFGPPPSQKLIRVAYSPRKTWGYVRAPFIIVSEDNSLSWRAQKFGPERDFRYLTHEMSHYWWNLADIDSPDDWINEGLADFSALLVSEELMGKDFANQLLSEYAMRASNAKTETPIVETEGNSPDREVNRYDKPDLLFRQLQKKYGDEATKRFLKHLYQQFAEAGKATTPLFLEGLELELGKDAREYFSNALYAKRWSKALSESNENR